MHIFKKTGHVRPRIKSRCLNWEMKPYAKIGFKDIGKQEEMNLDTKKSMGIK